jgi:hypothetical protein
MSRCMTGLLSVLVATTVTASARPAERTVTNLTMGSYISYMGGFEGEWSLTLYLGRDGRAIYTTSRREANESPLNAKRDVHRGRWEVSGTSLTVMFTDENQDHAVEYKITECLEYVSNTSVHCSLGLDPVERAAPHMFARPLWYIVVPGPRPK